MEPLDPTKIDESSGFSSRRSISSILKASQKSIRIPDPEQQENVVVPAKRVEKRSSKRVSFAPANDVLLFSKDGKNASPGRSPLQDLTTATAAATQNRVQVEVTEDRIQQIAGMETLLNAPLHASQQRDKVNFDVGCDFGEKTVMFSTDDAFMDMTHSHTINIANDGELHGDISLKNYEVLPTSREKSVMFAADDGTTDMTLSHTVNMTIGSVSLPSSRSVDLSAEMRNISSSVPWVDPGFENFLASLSKPRDPSLNPVTTRITPPAGASSQERSSSLTQIKTQSAYVDKANQAPTSVPAVMAKSLHTSRNIGEKSDQSALYPDDDVSMNMTEALTGNIQGITDEDDPFQCLFPTQEMYSQIDNRVSKTAEKTKQQSSEILHPFNFRDVTTLKNPLLHASQQRPKVNFDAKDECREKTIMFTAGDEFMDMTQSHTVNISSGSLTPLNQNRTHGIIGNTSSLEERKSETCGPPDSSANGVDVGFKNFLASLSKTSAPNSNPVTVRTVPPTVASSKETVDTNSCLSQLKTDVGKENQAVNTTRSSRETLNNGTICSENDSSMDMTEAQTGRIEGLTGSDDPFQFLFPTQDMYPHCESLKRADRSSGLKSSEALGSCNSTGMDTLLKPSSKIKVQRHQVKYDAEDDSREKTVRFSADDACMDVTQSHTVNIATDFKLQPHQNFDLLPPSGEKTVRFTTNDATMDMTQCVAVNIASNFISDSLLPVKTKEGATCGLPNNRSSSTDSFNVHKSLSKPTEQPSNIGDTQDMYTQNGHLKKGGMTSRQHHNDACRSSNHRDLDTSMTASSKTRVQGHQVNINAEDNCREKTVRFTALDGCMDVTKSHTVNIASDLELHSHQNLDFLPPCGEKTVRFTANDAAMDVTKSHTVNIASDLELHSHQNLDCLPPCGEKTVRFTANDAAMDVTKSHTVNIASDLELHSHQNLDFLPPYGERTVRFHANDAAMDVTRSHTVNITHQNVDFLPACGEKTLRFTAESAAMDVTRSHTVNIANNSVSDSVFPHQDSSILSAHENMDFPLSAKMIESETCHSRGNRPSSGHTLNPGFKKSLSKISGPWANPVISKAVAPAALPPQETVDTNGSLDQIKMHKPDIDKKESPGFASAVMDKQINKTMADCPEDNVSMDLTEAEAGNVLGQTSRDEPPQCPSTTQGLYPNWNQTEGTSKQSNGAQGSSSPNSPNSPDSNKTGNRKEPERRNQPCSPNAVDHDVDAAPSRKSRRMSLADLHSKVRRLSHMVNIAPDAIAIDNCTAPLPQLVQDMDRNSKDKTKSLPVMEPEPEMGLVNTEEDTQAQCLTEGEQPSTTTTPFNLKTKQLMSRLSVGGFKPKLPQKSKPDDPQKRNSVGEQTRTVTLNVTTQHGNFEADVSDIYDEELGSLEDMSEMLDTRSPQKNTEKMSPSQEFTVHEPLADDVLEQDFTSAAHGKKRPLPGDEINVEDEKRMKASTETAAEFEMGSQSCVVQCDSNITAAPCMTAQTTDYSSSGHTASLGCEATFESTFKQSLFESQLDDYASDVQRKFDEGTITVLEFFKFFNIDFVIHNPRQSVLPGRLSSDTDPTLMDLLKDRHINRPKQTVYETNVLNLTEKVEGLKERMRDLDKPLKIVNRHLWEETRNCTDNTLKSFSAKLKERYNLFRKTSKVQSHEMKEVLYSDLVQTNLEEQQRLRGTIQEADGMIKSLDECIGEIETELAAVEEKGSEDTPSLKSRQEAMQKVTEALEENEQQISELEIQKKQNTNKLNRLKAETRNLDSHISALHMVNEWKLGEKTDNCTIYTFLHDTLYLQLAYGEHNGNDGDNRSERKISHITFKHQLNDEQSQDHACLIHKLLSQYFEGEDAWVEKYPTSKHVPKLLHDVGLVVSRCRLLGEELRLLKMWGGLRLDILNISCEETRVQIVFSSLKKFYKFEVIFLVILTNHLYVLQVQTFKNMIGATTIHQIEEIVASFSPAKNLLTKIVKRIHENLL